MEFSARSPGWRFHQSVMVVSVVVILAVTVLLGLWLHSCSSRSIKTELWDHTERVTKLAQLTLAEKTTTESLTQTESVGLLRGWVHSEAIYEVQWTVVYSYHIDARPNSWRLNLSGGVLDIEAPDIEAGVPAVDSASVKARVESGWLIFHENAKLANLTKDVSRISASRANDAAHLGAVRDSCRAALESFFSEWLASVGKSASIRRVHVRFAGESNPRSGID